MNREPFAPGEWYHCYSRAVEGIASFEEPRDYERFLQLLYICNAKKTIHRSNFAALHTAELTKMERGNTLVNIGAYCLMPNHFHLLLQEKEGGGITNFMRKLGTAYVMYFNIKNRRIGNLFVRPFRSRHTGNDRYFQQVLQYIHCNPAELYEPGWKMGSVKSLKQLEKKLCAYPYSSLATHTGENGDFSIIVDTSVFEISTQQSIEKMLTEASLYYKEHMSR